MMSPGELLNRATSPGALTDRQRAVFTMIVDYNAATGEPCSLSYVSRRLGLHRSTIRDHIKAIHRKGWLRAPGAPAFARIDP